MRLIPTYTDGINGYTHVEYLTPELEPILNETFGVIVYQEQTMRIATDLAGYTPGQADMLRKAIGKKKPEIMRVELGKLLNGSVDDKIPGMIANGISPDAALRIVEMIEKFAAYGFNKSHATAYAVIAFQTAYYKAHFPLELMCAQLIWTSTKEKYLKYIYEVPRLGFGFLRPDINISGSEFTTENGAIRFGLSNVKGIGPNVASYIIPGRPFTCLKDVTDLPKKEVNKKALYSLALSGALDQLTEETNRMEIFKQLLVLRGDKTDVTDAVTEFTNLKKLEAELELLSIYVSGHPLADIAAPIEWDMMEYGKIYTTHARIDGIKAIKTKKKEDMCFLNLNTLEGNKDITIFPTGYEKVKEQLEVGKVIKITFKREVKGLIATSIAVPKKYNK